MMKSIHVTRKASKFAPQDVISSVPEDVITNILDRLPIQDAVRTGILSRDWRFKWTMLTQLVFNEVFFEYLQKKGVEKYHAMIISRLLLHLKGPVLKFDLYIDRRCCSLLDVENINNWIMFLSTKGIQDLTLTNRRETSLKLHTHLFSCLELRHLVLINCCVRPMASFRGFSNLLTLNLDAVRFDSYTCGQVLTRSPLLEILKISYHPSCDIKRDEIVNLENLKVLSLPLFTFDKTRVITRSSIYQLIGFFPKLQELTLDFMSCGFSEDACKRIPTSLPCLKILKLDRLLECSSDFLLSCVFDLICCAPNLQTLKITAICSDVILPPTLCFSEVDYNRMGQLLLRKVTFRCIGGLKNEALLIKTLLASSPFLKRMRIHVSSSKFLYSYGARGEIMFATELLKLHRASAISEIDLIWAI